MTDESRLVEIRQRLVEIAKESDSENITDKQLNELRGELDALVEEKRVIEARQEEIRYFNSPERRSLLNRLATGEEGYTLEASPEKRSVKPMDDNKDLQLRSLQKYLIDGGSKNMNDAEMRALDLSGSAAVLPVGIMDQLITSTKYSDLLSRATVLQQANVGNLKIPIASNNYADWKIENVSVDTSSVSYEKTPTMTALEIKPNEIYRWSRVSAATLAGSTASFVDMLLKLLGEELVGAIEYSFFGGSGTAQPKGLDNLVWSTTTNQVLTSNSSTPIVAADIAEAISFLPQKYARNAVVICNADMLYNISMFKGTTEYAYGLADGATKFLGKEIIVSEHCPDDTVYVADPSQLYVNFFQPIQLEADRSSGFTAASVDLRALAVVGAAWNPAACVAIGLGA